MTQELNVANLLQTLRRRWLLIALVLIATIGATFVYSLLRPPTYQARAVLRVRVPQFQWNIDPAVQRIIDTKRDWRRGFMLLGQTKTVAERAVAGLNLTVDSNLLARVTLRAESTDNILLDASGPTAADAAQLASLADETPEGRSIVVLAKDEYNLRGRDTTQHHFVPFSAHTRMSGCDIASLRNPVAAEMPVTWSGPVDPPCCRAMSTTSPSGPGATLVISPMTSRKVPSR